MTNAISIISKKVFLKKNKEPSQKKVWSSIGKSWSNYISKEIPTIKKFLKNKTGKIVDCGCGSGRNMLSGKLTYYEVDFSNNQLQQAEIHAKKNKINAKFFKQDLANLKFFKNNMFDYGLLIASLHCIESEKNRKKALEELYRVLKPNAEALITVWNSEDKRFNSVNNHGDVYLSYKNKNKKYMRYYYLFKKQELINFIKKTGFKIIKLYPPREKDRFSRKNWIVRIKKI